MPRYIITPWTFHSQLLQVRSAFYPHSPPKTAREKREQDELKRRAVATVGVWVKRGNCPHLLESTATLCAAELGDGSKSEAWCVRAAYASAFSRFVTGLLDSHQDKRGKRSMYSIAKILGLPATYVELRHQATHEELPPLSKLRTASQKALKWIWDYYWVHLTEEVSQDDKCKAMVRKWIEEKDQRARSLSEQTLRNMDEDQVIKALMESYDSIEDVDAKLRIVSLHSKLLQKEGMESEVPPTAKSLDDVKAELEKIESDLNKMEDVRTAAPVSRANVITKTHPTGWTLWEGPWIPKPIGVV